MDSLWVVYQNQGARKHGPTRKHAATETVAISFIRTVTVGSGISPDLLTSARGCPRTERSRAPAIAHRYRRWGISPRPENAASQ